jgi:Zn-dependent protease with chaperone function
MGMYIVQSICHSAVAAAVADISILAWKVNSPLLRQRFRVIVILVPIFSFPLYQAINPDRGSISFRLEALFDINKWLNLELWGKIPFGTLFILMLTITAIVFVLQEMIPVLRHVIESGKSAPVMEDPPDSPVLKNALEGLPGEKPDISIIDDDELILFSSTGREPNIFLSTGLLREFDAEQLQVAIAHEIAHIKRSRKPLLVLVFIFRVLMLFNPVALIEFRKTVQEEEKICDSIAVSITEKPQVLAEVLGKFRTGAQGNEGLGPVKLSSMANALERYSHDMLLQSRILRLKQETAYGAGEGWFQFAVTLVFIIFLNYFIV